MCMLSVIGAGIPADDFLTTELLNGCLTNRDGFGSVCIVNGELVIHRSMDYAEALEVFAKNRTRGMGMPAMFHSRWATHGEYGLENVHPFYYGTDRQTVLAHNGIMPKSFHPKPGDRRSDTAKFAAAMPYMGHLDDDEASLRISKVLGYGNKVAVLTVNPEYDFAMYLWGESRGEYSEKTGAWHSNSDYEGTWTPAIESVRSMMGTHKLPDLCPYCYTYGELDTDWRVYQCCGTCGDCSEGARHCVCFASASQATAAADEYVSWWNQTDERAWQLG